MSSLRLHHCKMRLVDVFKLNLMILQVQDNNAGLKTVHKQIYGYRASAYLVREHMNSHDALQQEILDRRRRKQVEDTSLVTNIVFFLLCLLILVIIVVIVWFRFLKPRVEVKL